ncbi:MAG: SDR family oxidoreductase [Bacteriovoracaceae bacterium]|nr:SDR family oxidoreductase [Bacteriovoracaceae bacterium]
MKKILVTGASGFLGHYICREFASDYQVTGTYNRFHPKTLDCELVQIDLNNIPHLEETLSKISPSAIIHAGALSKPYICEEDESLSHQINVQASQAIAKYASPLNIPLLFTSSDQVYDGRKAPYNESSETCPMNIYGKHKLEAEVKISEAYSRATICRLPLMFGHPEGESANFFSDIFHKLSKNETVKALDSEYRCPLSATEAAKVIRLCLEHPGELFVVAGKQRVTRVDIARYLAAFLKKDFSLIEVHRNAGSISSYYRPADLAANIGKLRSIGYNPPIFKEDLKNEMCILLKPDLN